MTGQPDPCRIASVLSTAVAAVDEAGTYVFVNDAYAAMFDGDAPALGLSVFDLCPVADSTEFLQGVRDTARDHQRRCVRQSSDYLNRVFENDLSWHDGMVVIEVRDVTGEHHSSAERRRLDAARDTTWARTKSDFLLVDILDRTVTATPGLWRRWPVAELLTVVSQGRVLDYVDNPTTWRDPWVGPESALDGRVERAVAEVYASGQEQSYRTVVPVEPDDVRHYDVELVPWVVDGERRGAIMVAHDVSAQLRAEQREAMTAASMQQLLSRMPVTLWQVERVDGSAWPLFPDRRENPDPAWGTPRPLAVTFDFLAPSSIDDLWAVIRAMEGNLQETITVGTVDQQRWMQLSLSLVDPTADELHSHVLVVATDVTEEMAVAEADSRIDHATHVMRFAQGVAHDFGNVAQVIGGYSDLLMRSQDPAVVAQASARLQSAAHRAVEVSRRIARIAKVQQVVNEPVDLSALMLEQVPILRDQFEPTLHLTVTAEPHLIAFAESVQVTSAVENLCLNAAQAMGNDGHVHVNVARVSRRGRDYVEVSVADDGPGIPADILDRVFDPFVTGRPNIGTGLGLYLIQEYLYSVGGQVEVENRDRGAIFRMRFQPARVRRSDTIDPIDTVESSPSVSPGGPR